jgi:bifunctional non-homologous end joining protein LigD
MGLKEYNKKRDFRKTSEPKGNMKSGKNLLHFVVQKHAARNLHYDFRLELDGVLKSWAVPKGPSLDPKIKRLAMHVEDHPYDYRTFEGTIPDGEYGAGEVIVWDEGTYHAIGTDDKKESEKILREGYEKGDFKFYLEGQKLKGEFVLVKMKNRGEKQWLLIKHKDKYVSTEDILQDERSVISDRTLEDVAKGVEVKKK